jgi:hypothetical protein
MKYYFPIILLLFTSCNKAESSDELTLNETKWKKGSIREYEFTLRISCFCPPETVGPHKIRVQADTIFSVNGIPYQRGVSKKLPTLSELFTFIRESDTRNPYKKSVTYQTTFGFPEYIFYDFSEQIADEEILYVVSDFKKN